LASGAQLLGQKQQSVFVAACQSPSKIAGEHRFVRDGGKSLWD